MQKLILLEISARHIHLSKNSLEDLFCKNYQLKKLKDLSQTGEFAAQETVDVVYQGEVIKNVRIIGPVRDNSQLELTLTDCRKLKLLAPVKLSGDLKGAPLVEVKRGRRKSIARAIVAKRHLHIDPLTAKNYKLKNNQKVSIAIQSLTRALVFQEVVVRVKEGYKLAAHIDTDEANAAGLLQCSVCRLIR